MAYRRFSTPVVNASEEISLSGTADPSSNSLVPLRTAIGCTNRCNSSSSPAAKSWRTIEIEPLIAELATAYFLRYVVTTNWDTYFEEIAAATPIVIPDDYAFWNVEGRKVFKLHGSMHNLSTIVATKADYDRCYRRLRTGIIGSTFQHLLATKRVVFVGYSFGDSDLNRMLRYLRRELADILPRSYVVTPHGYRGTEFPAERVIQTDGTFFIQKLKDIAVERHALRDPEAVSRLFDLSERLTEAHGQVSSSFHVKEVPAVIHTLAYQDGMRHAIDRVMARMGSGEYFDLHGTMHKIQAYEEIRTGAIRARRYFDAAYADGYEAGLIALELDGNEIRRIPLYFVWGSGNDLRSFAGFRRALRQAGKLHKAATNEARRLVADVAEGLIVTHEPFLDVDRYRALGQTPGGRGQ